MSSASRTAFPGLTTLLALFFLVTTAMADWNYAYCSSENTASDQSPMYWQYQSNGKCKELCNNNGMGDYAYFVVQDANCWCSNYIPATQVDIGECDEECPGFGDEKCGKPKKYYLYVELAGNPSGTAGVSQPSSTKVSSSSEAPASSGAPKPTTSSSSKPSAIPDTITSTSDPPSPPASEHTEVVTVTSGGGVVVVTTRTIISGPSATAQPELTGKSKSNTGTIVGGVVGGIGGLALIIGGLFFLLWRRRKQQRAEEGGESGEPGVHRYASTMSKAGLLRSEKPPQHPPPIATSFNRRHSRGLDQESISPISGSDRRNSSFRLADQRLNPSTIFVFDNSSRASVGSLDDSRDYHRTLNVRNPDFQS